MLKWADLMGRVFEFVVLACSTCCGGRLRLVATIDDPELIRRILGHLGLPTTLAPRCQRGYRPPRRRSPSTPRSVVEASQERAIAAPSACRADLRPGSARIRPSLRGSGAFVPRTTPAAPIGVPEAVSG